MDLLYLMEGLFLITGACKDMKRKEMKRDRDRDRDKEDLRVKEGKWRKRKAKKERGRGKGFGRRAKLMITVMPSVPGFFLGHLWEQLQTI